MTAAEARADAPSRRRRGEALEDAICAAALDELRGSGYSGFTFDAVTARAHTGKASIYRVVGRRQLVMDAICRSMPRPQGRWPTSCPTPSPRDALLLMFESMVVGMSVSTDALRCIVTGRRATWSGRHAEPVGSSARARWAHRCSSGCAARRRPFGRALRSSPNWCRAS